MKKLISALALLLASCQKQPMVLDLPGVKCDLARYSIQPSSYMGKDVNKASCLCPSGATATAFMSSSGALVGIKSDDADVLTTYLGYSLGCKYLGNMLNTNARLPEAGHASSCYCADRNSFLVLFSSANALLVEEFWQPDLEKARITWQG
jgi:hypothetical protein